MFERISSTTFCTWRPLKNQQYKTLVEDLVPITFGRLNLTRGKPKPKNIRVLLDSGSSGTVMYETLAKRLKVKKPLKPNGRQWQDPCKLGELPG